MKQNYNPPRSANRILKWFLAPHLLEAIEGDLQEAFQYNAKRVGLRKAQWIYWLEVSGFFKPKYIKRKRDQYPSISIINHNMIRNYFKISWRNLSQSKWYSALTIFGLALGLAVSLLSVLYVQDELSFDDYNIKSDRIYRINSDITYAGKSSYAAVAPTPMGQTLKSDFPEIEEATRLGKYGSQLVKSDKMAIRESKILYADSTVFNVFTFPMVAGNPKKALAEPQSVVITEKMAQKYFGTKDALNRTLTFDMNDVRKITGIIEEIPAQSHFQADFLLPLHETKDAKMNKWGNHIFNTYVLLKPGTDAKSVDAKFEKILQTYLDPALRQFFQTTLAETRKAGNNYHYSLMPLKDIHLYSDRQGELLPNNSIEYVYIFAIIGLFILLIAVFNFINLATARSAKRAREVGVRKVMGSNRHALIFQFLSESLLTTFIALVAGIALLYLLLPTFNTLAAKQLSITNFISISTVAYIISGTGLVGAVAGIYPAIYLSSFKPVTALKGGSILLNKKEGLRSFLVVFQFALSVLLVIGTMLVNQQLRYIQTKRVGFDKEQVLTVKTSFASASQIATFQNEVQQNPSVKMGTVSGFLPVTSSRWNDMWLAEKETDQKNAVNMQEWMVDPDYIPTLSLELVQGQNFMHSRATDQSAIIINESAVKRFGYQNPVGKIIHKAGGEQMTIIGVVKDFHYESLRNKIEPLGMVVNGAALSSSLEKSFLEAVSFKLNTTNIPAAVSSIEKTWKQLVPGQLFEYSFLSEDFDAMYRSEQRVESLFTAFAAIAILIACLGLFGLSAYSAEQRTKEIGVRKVLGASVASIAGLLSKDFLKPVVIAIVIASPIAWYAVTKWLEDFAYKVEIQWWVFALAGVLSLLIALLTVSFQSIKAALTDPVKSLRSD